jgi:hypothetical protein
LSYQTIKTALINIKQNSQAKSKSLQYNKFYVN